MVAAVAQPAVIAVSSGYDHPGQNYAVGRHLRSKHRRQNNLTVAAGLKSRGIDSETYAQAVAADDNLRIAYFTRSRNCSESHRQSRGGSNYSIDHSSQNE